MPHNLSRERDLPEPLKIRADWSIPVSRTSITAAQIMYLDRLYKLSRLNLDPLMSLS
jgi:hypothetical protein